MNRSKAGALEELQRIRSEALATESDPSVSAVISASLLEEVLELAWRHQFDEDRSAFRQDVQHAVGDAIERYYLDQGEK